MGEAMLCVRGGEVRAMIVVEDDEIFRQTMAEWTADPATEAILKVSVETARTAFLGPAADLVRSLFPPPQTHVVAHFKTGGDWIPVHRSTLERLGDADLLKAALGSLSPNNLKTAGLTPEQVSAMESLYALAEAKDFFTDPPLVQPATADARVERALAILQAATPGNCDRKNRHGFGDCGAEKNILDAIAVLQGREPSA